MGGHRPLIRPCGPPSPQGEGMIFEKGEFDMNEWKDEALLPEGWEEGTDLFAPEEEKVSPEEEISAPEEASPAPERDYAAEVALLRRVWPDFKELPEEVAQMAAEGESLVAAYAVWQGREHLKEAQALRAENDVLRRNADAAARAPVRGLKGSGKQKVSDFERGMDLM